MTKVLLLVGSPRGKKSTSYSIGDYLLNLLQKKELETTCLIIKRELSSDEKISKMLDEINNSDVIILTAPLYDDCQPYIVIRTMELIHAKKMNLENKRFIPIINCGFSESVHITAVAIPIYHKFAKTVGFKWSGSLSIAGGEMFRGRFGKQLDDLGKVADIMRNLLEEIATKISSEIDIQDLTPKILPKFFYWKLLKRPFTWLNNRNWKKVAEQNGGVVDATPYLD